MSFNKPRDFHLSVSSFNYKHLFDTTFGRMFSCTFKIEKASSLRVLNSEEWSGVVQTMAGVYGVKLLIYCTIPWGVN